MVLVVSIVVYILYSMVPVASVLSIEVSLYMVLVVSIVVYILYSMIPVVSLV